MKRLEKSLITRQMFLRRAISVKSSSNIRLGCNDESRCMMLFKNRSIPNFIESVSDQSAATLKATGTKFDFAISGPGFFEISTKWHRLYTKRKFSPGSLR